MGATQTRTIAIDINVTGAEKGKKKINLLNEAFNGISGELLRAQKRMATVSKQLQTGLINTGFRNMSKNVRGVTSVMSLTNKELDDFNQSGFTFANRTARMTNKIRTFTAGVRGFRMEFLSVLFFGMAMQRVFFGMLKPAAEAVGLTKLWSTTLQILFLPVMIALLPHLLAFMAWILDLPAPVQKALGAMAIFLGGVGAMMFFFATIGLGIGGITQLTELWKGFGKLITNISSFKVPKDLAGLFGKTGLFAKLEKSLLLKTITLAVGIKLLWEFTQGISAMMTDLSTAWSDRLKSVLQGTFGAAAIGFTFGGFAGAITGATIGFSISILLNLFDIAWEHDVDQMLIDFFTAFKDRLLELYNKALDSFKLERDTIVVTLPDGSTLLKPNPNPPSLFNRIRNAIPSPIGVGRGILTAPIEIINNFNGFTEDGLDRKLDERDKLMVEQINSSSTRPQGE